MQKTPGHSNVIIYQPPEQRSQGGASFSHGSYSSDVIDGVWWPVNGIKSARVNINPDQAIELWFGYYNKKLGSGINDMPHLYKRFGSYMDILFYASSRKGWNEACTKFTYDSGVQPRLYNKHTFRLERIFPLRALSLNLNTINNALRKYVGDDDFATGLEKNHFGQTCLIVVLPSQGSYKNNYFSDLDKVIAKIVYESTSVLNPLRVYPCQVKTRLKYFLRYTDQKVEQQVRHALVRLLYFESLNPFIRKLISDGLLEIDERLVRLYLFGKAHDELHALPDFRVDSL